MIAESERQAGSPPAALRLYRRFYRAYPRSSVADDALFWSAEILLKQQHVDEAKGLYERLARSKSNFSTSARERLSSIAAAETMP